MAYDEEKLKFLSEDYIVDEILFRDAEIKEIQTQIDNFKNKTLTSNLYILGKNSTGKTLVIKKMLKENPDLIQYIRIGSNINTTLDFLNNVTDSNFNNVSNAFEAFYRKLNTEKKIIVIDEIDKLKDPKNLINNINFLYRDTKGEIPFFLITNNAEFYDELPDDFKNTLLFKKIYFFNYSRDQIKEIIKQRLDLSQIQLDYGIVDLITLESYNNDSNIRLALNLIKQCYINNIIVYNKDVESFINNIMTQYYQVDYLFILSQLNLKEKACLKKIMTIAEELKPNENNIIEIPSKLVYEALESPLIDSSTISKLISNLEKTKLFTSEKTSGGRHSSLGVYKIIKLHVKTLQALEKLKDKFEWFKMLFKYLKSKDKKLIRWWLNESGKKVTPNTKIENLMQFKNEYGMPLASFIATNCSNSLKLYLISNIKWRKLKNRFGVTVDKQLMDSSPLSFRKKLLKKKYGKTVYDNLEKQGYFKQVNYYEYLTEWFIKWTLKS